MRGSTETELQVGPVRTTDPDPLTQSLSALSSPAADRSEETSLKHKDQKNMSHHTLRVEKWACPTEEGGASTFSDF